MKIAPSGACILIIFSGIKHKNTYGGKGVCKLVKIALAPSHIPD